MVLPGGDSLRPCRSEGGQGYRAGPTPTRRTLRTARVDGLLCWRDGCDAGTIPAVPQGGGAIWGRHRIEEAPAVGPRSSLGPCPTYPEGRVLGWPGRNGEAASTRGRYAQCPGSIGPPGAEIVFSGRRRWTSSARLCPQCPMATHLGPAAQLGRRLQRWGDTATAPGRWSHPGQRSYWACAGVDAPPHPGSYLECPRRTRLGPALGLARRLRRGCATSTMPRVGGPIRGRDRIGQGADRGAAPPPGAYPQCPRRTRLG